MTAPGNDFSDAASGEGKIPTRLESYLEQVYSWAGETHTHPLVVIQSGGPPNFMAPIDIEIEACKRILADIEEYGVSANHQKAILKSLYFSSHGPLLMALNDMNPDDDSQNLLRERFFKRVTFAATQTRFPDDMPAAGTGNDTGVTKSAEHVVVQLKPGL